MNIIIAGAGDVGTHLAKMLSNESNNLTIIGEDEYNLNKIGQIADAVTVLGKPTSIDTLKKAGVEKADLFIAVSPAQEQDVNIISALLAKKMGSKKVTARINNEEYLHSDNKLLFKDMGIDLLFYPEKIASYEIVDLLNETGTSEFMSFGKGKLQMVVLRIDDGAPIIDKNISEITSYEDYISYKPVAIARNGDTIIPNSETKFMEGDLIYAISTKEGVKKVMELSGKNEIDVKKLMVVGGGSIGKMLAEKMEKRVEMLKIIEIKENRCEYLAQALRESLIINGDGRNTDLLISENVKDFDAFVAVTGSSETNIISCIAAKRMGVPKTIAEVENIEYIKLAEDMGVDSVINKKLITAGRVFRFTLTNKVESIKCLNGSEAEILEYIVNPKSLITQGPIKDLDFPVGAIIGGVMTNKEGKIANEYTTINPYDRVVVFALPEALSDVNKFFI
ncbi:MAG: Trk system potassium transporter TrkA [Bacteroidales bacterium]|jgi:trk system potassium uptake protein TrkA|nr:Trk system potassium transporter TrkA [Bacteroidales bacterium]